MGVSLKNSCCCPVCKVAGLLVVVGALNWGMIGGFNRNIVSQLLGSGTTAEKVVYILVGIAGIMKLLSCFIRCPLAKKGEGADCGHKH